MGELLNRRNARNKTKSYWQRPVIAQIVEFIKLYKSTSNYLSGRWLNSFEISGVMAGDETETEISWWPAFQNETYIQTSKCSIYIQLTI